MTDFSDFKTQIAEYANRQDWSDALVTGFVRQAEQKFNSDLRIDRMIGSAQNTVACECGALPDDWLQMDLVLIGNQNNTPTTWTPIRYKPRDEFFRQSALPYTGTSPMIWNSTLGYYTIEGREMFFGGPPDTVNGQLFQIYYYQEVPVFSDALSSWVYTKFPKLYLYAALANSDFHAVGEEQKGMSMDQMVDQMIIRLNDNWRLAKASGSRLARTQVRSFG